MDIFKQALGNIVGGSILDIATQKGDFIQTLTENLKSYRDIIGIDISEEAIEKAQKTFGQENIQFIQMDAGQLRFEDERFDTVSPSAALHHLENIPQALAEAKRVLKPGGYFILAEMHRDGQTEAQLTMIQLHHWAAAVDTALGISHNKTLARQEFVDYLAKLGLRDVAFYDFSDTESDPMDEAVIPDLNDMIDTYTQRVVATPGYTLLKRRGEALRRRIHEVGVQREPIIVVVGQK